jgi:hypothetical protein
MTILEKKNNEPQIPGNVKNIHVAWTYQRNVSTVQWHDNKTLSRMPVNHFLNVQKDMRVQNVASHRLRNTGALCMRDSKWNASCFIPQRALYTLCIWHNSLHVKTVIYTWAKQYSIKHAHIFPLLLLVLKCPFRAYGWKLSMTYINPCKLGPSRLTYKIRMWLHNLTLNHESCGTFLFYAIIPELPYAKHRNTWLNFIYIRV